MFLQISMSGLLSVLAALGGCPLFWAQLGFQAATLLQFYSWCLCFLILKSACFPLRLDFGSQNYGSNQAKIDIAVLGCVLSGENLITSAVA